MFLKSLGILLFLIIYFGFKGLVKWRAKTMPDPEPFTDIKNYTARFLKLSPEKLDRDSRFAEDLLVSRIELQGLCDALEINPGLEIDIDLITTFGDLSDEVDLQFSNSTNQ